MAQSVPKLGVRGKFSTVVMLCPGITFGMRTIPSRFLNVHLSLLVERNVPTMVIRVRNKDKLWLTIHAGMV